jgi:hypothetical protein
MTAMLRLDVFAGDQALVVRPVGALTWETYPALRDGLLKCATQEPAAVVVDLDSMSADPSTLTVFSTVCLRITDWPGIPLVLASARQPLRACLDASSVPHFVPTHRSVAAALESLRIPPPRRRRQVTLPDDATCIGHARRVVQQTCDDWRINQITVEATQVVSELAENALVHAGSARWLRLELRGRTLTVAVTDPEPREPRLRPTDQRKAGGRGLVLVAALSRAWGSTPQPQGGKTVWAVLTITDQART